MWGILFVTWDIYGDLAWGTSHFNLVVLVRRKPIGAYVVIWRPLLPGLQACSCTAGSSEGRSFEGRTAGSREEEGGTWELDHTNILTKSTFFSQHSRLQLSMLYKVADVEVSNIHATPWNYGLAYWTCCGFNYFFAALKTVVTRGSTAQLPVLASKEAKNNWFPVLIELAGE